MPAVVDQDKCEGCAECIEACPTEAIEMVDEKAKIKEDECADCAACVDECPKEAISMD